MLENLDFDQLETLANYLEGNARKLRALAQSTKNRPTRLEVKARRERLFALPSEVMALTKKMPLDKAVSQVARDAGISARVVWTHLERDKKAMTRLRRIWQRTEIMRMAGLGRSNAEISEMVGCSAGHVSRVIQSELKKCFKKARPAATSDRPGNP